MFLQKGGYQRVSFFVEELLRSVRRPMNHFEVDWQTMLLIDAVKLVCLADRHLRVLIAVE